VILLANTREDVEKEAGMIISQELLRETEDRYKQREEPREENVQKIEAGKVLEANSLRLVQKRLERLAHAEVPGDFQPRPSRLRSQVRSQIAQILLALLWSASSARAI
jgi:hypothetical protein